jgi:hypothetical protein
MAKCKEEKTTVTGALAAACAIEIRKLIKRDVAT